MIRNDYSNTLNFLLSSQAIRLSCQKIYDLAEDGGTHFRVHTDQLPHLAQKVSEHIKKRYPDLDIPFHARLRHFRSFNQDRISDFLGTLTHKSPVERAKSIIDLIIISVLLDAGAGEKWSYHERHSGETFRRSEGLAIASYHMFREGLFSMDYSASVQGEALKKLPADSLGHGFQVSSSNPIIGLESRTRVMNRLGEILCGSSELFPNQRPGDILEHIHKNYGDSIPAGELLQVVLNCFNTIWNPGARLDDVALGDAWEYPPFQDEPKDSQKIVVFHKLSQWLSYSLIEPIESVGIKVTHLDQLTGLPEYRNGGLFVDGGVLELKDPSMYDHAHSIGSELVIEWRALTVILLDMIAPLICDQLGKTSEEFPLVKILEGGTWSAGRELAQLKRTDGSTPIKLLSDGTTF